MSQRALKNLGAGYPEALALFPGKLHVQSRGHCHVVSFQTEHKDTQINFEFDESYPSRIPKPSVVSTTLDEDQTEELCSELVRKGKGQEYNDALTLPILLEYAVSWLGDSYGKQTRSNGEQRKVKQPKQKTPREQVRPERQRSGPSPGTPTDKVWQTENCQAEDWANIPHFSTEDWGSGQVDTWVDSVLDTGEAKDDNDQDDWDIVNTKQKTKKKTNSKTTSAKSKLSAEDLHVDNPPYDSRRANYFIAIRCTNDEIGSAVEDVVKKMLAIDNIYKPICYNRKEVHVTLTTVALHSPEEVTAAVTALENARDILVQHAPQSLLTISGLDNFQGSKVVYGKVKVEEDVLLLRKVIRWVLQKAGIAPRDGNDFTPHMTLVKTNVPFTRDTGLSTVATNVYSPFLNQYFGKQGVKGIHLCKMGHERRNDGFYVCPTHIDFKEKK